MFKKTLGALDQCDKDYSKVFIPIGCQETGKPGHNIAVILEKADVGRGYKATILDQMGGAAYSATKRKIMEDLTAIGIRDIHRNMRPISQNRNDCATVTSLLAELTCEGMDMREISYGLDNREYVINHSGIDKQHFEDQQCVALTLNKMAQQYRDSNLTGLRQYSGSERY